MSESMLNPKYSGELYVRSVVSLDGEPLGWTVCVLKHTEEGNQQASLLMLRQCVHQWEVRIIESAILRYLADQRKTLKGRLISPDWESISKLPLAERNWVAINGDALADFYDPTKPLVWPRHNWHPSRDDILAEAFQHCSEYAQITRLEPRVRQVLEQATKPSGSGKA